MQPRQVLVYPCRPEGLGRPIRASISELSSTGLGFVCLAPLAVGSRFVLRMDQLGAGPLLQVYHVIRCRGAGGGAWMVGALFDEVFTGTCALPASATTPGASPAKPAC